MALVTVGAVVHVTADSLMLSISRWLVMGVAGDAREHEIIRRIGVAVTALVDPVMRDREISVVEHRPQPRTRVVTRLAGGWESGCNVVRVGGAVVVSLVAAVTGGRKRQVVIVDVAAGTRHGRMESGQRERGVVVIERRWNPCGGVVANLALLREANLRVVGRVGGVEVIQVTSDAGGAGQVVIVVDVALRTLQRGVRAGQRKSS